MGGVCLEEGGVKTGQVVGLKGWKTRVFVFLSIFSKKSQNLKNKLSR